MRLNEHAPGLWTVDAPQRFMGMALGTRMTVVRLDDGTVWLHSSIPLDDALAAEIDAIGPVGWIVVPNLWHHLYAVAAKTRYPSAQLVAPPTITNKNAKLADTMAPLEAAPAWGNTVRAIPLEGAPKLGETAFFHSPSRSLILTDGMFNIRKPKGWWTRLSLWLVGGSGGPRQSRVERFMVKDRTAFVAALDAMLALEPERIILAHGAVVTEDAPEALRQASAWARR